MAQQQQNITISAPGFQGLNTEDSPLQQDPGFALEADNCVIDKFGRVGAREAFSSYTEVDAVPYVTNGGMVTETKQVKQLGGGVINNVRYDLGIVSHLQYDAAGVLVQEDYYIVEFDQDAMGSLPYPTVAFPGNLSRAKIIPFNNAIYIFSSKNIALKFDGTTITNLFTGVANTDYIAPQDDTGTLAANIDGDVVCNGYGRLWVSGVNEDYNTIYYSDLLLATQWYDGKAVPTDTFNSAGIIDVSQYWPNGGDRITAIEAHNNFLVIFGRQSILLYSSGNGFADPADVNGFVLQDAISNMGAVSRDAVVSIGAELLYVDDSGVRGLGRTIQEKSVPLGDLTSNVKRDITDLIRDEPNDAISLFYMPNKNLVICNFANTEQAYAIEMRQPSATGGNKITRWTNCTFNRGLFVEFEDLTYTLLAGKDSGGALQYDNYLDWTGNPYRMKYASNAFTFGDAVRQKFVKQVDFTLVSTFINAPAVVKWGYAGLLEYSANKTIIAQQPALFNVAYFNQGEEYGEGLSTLKRYRTNTKGSGALVRVALETEIAGNSLSIQEINIQTLLGRIY
jgi:hypothetical protein